MSRVRLLEHSAAPLPSGSGRSPWPRHPPRAVLLQGWQREHVWAQPQSSKRHWGPLLGSREGERQGVVSSGPALHSPFLLQSEAGQDGEPRLLVLSGVVPVGSWRHLLTFWGSVGYFTTQAETGLLAETVLPGCPYTSQAPYLPYAPPLQAPSGPGGFF